jgi:hypothetical protein
MVLAPPKVSGSVGVEISSFAFMVKAHEFEWAFGFGLEQNTGPDLAGQEISSHPTVSALSPPVTTTPIEW